MSETFKHQTAVDAAAAARYLTELAEGLAAGRLPLLEGDRALTVHTRGFIDLGLKVRRNNGRARVTLELSWGEAESDLPLLAER